MIRFLAIFLLCITSFKLHAQKNMSLLGYLGFDVKVNDIWGYEHNGNEYALVGSEIGLYLVDITIANQPVLLFEILGDTSIWRDVKVYNDFAYVVNEQGGGLLIADLRQLPNALPYQYVSQIDSFTYHTAHNIFIDEVGFAYLLGSNIGNKGAFIIDLNTTNRYQPSYAGIYDDLYVHDAFVRGDTLYTAEISNGSFSVVDVSNKLMPVVLARQETSRSFTHNCSLSDDGKYLITTDEKPGAFVDLYKIDNLNNIQLLDQYQSSPLDSVIPHNTFFKGEYIFTSYYRDGLTLVDAHLKNNLVEIGNYDSSPFSSDKGFEGNWGVYPYFSSGKIILSDREEGLFILAANYTRAAYLEGTVFDTLNNIPINEARIEVLGEDFVKFSQFNGSYHIGVADSAYYDIRMYKPGCQTLIESHILLETALTKVLNFETNCDLRTGIANLGNEHKIQVISKEHEDLIQISVNSEEELKALVLLDLNGKVIKKYDLNDRKISIALHQKLNAGLYLLNFIFEHSQENYKLLKI